MADNTQLPIPTTSGDIIAADDISGVKFQRIKMILGSDGNNDGDISGSNPMPITAASLPLPIGASSEATVSAINNLTDTLVYLLGAINGQLPRLDAARREAVVIESGILPTVTTVSTVSNITSQGGYPAFFGLNPTPWGIYDRIVVS